MLLRELQGPASRPEPGRMGAETHKVGPMCTPRQGSEALRVDNFVCFLTCFTFMINSCADRKFGLPAKELDTRLCILDLFRGNALHAMAKTKPKY